MDIDVFTLVSVDFLLQKTSAAPPTSSEVPNKYGFDL